MVRHLHSVLTLVLGFFSVAASAQAPATVTKPDDGYYRGSVGKRCGNFFI